MIMSVKEEVLVLEKITTMLNDDKYGMSRFLQATPYTDHDYFSFQGLIDEDVFYSHLYYESEYATNKKKELYKMLKGNAGINTFFILGYQGCGKTTFVNALLNYYIRYARKEVNEDYLIDCDKNGTDGEKEQLRIILSKKIIKYIISHKDILCNYLDFYRRNHMILRECVNAFVLHDIWKYFSVFISEKKDIEDPDDLNELEKFFNKLSVRDSLYVIVLFYLANKYYDDDQENDVYFLFVDNLDYIDDYEQLGLFMDAIKALTTDMDKIFNRLCFSKNSSASSNNRFTEKIKILIAMRETTKANIPNPHGVDFFDSIHSYEDITELYNKNGIVDWRLKFINRSTSLSPIKKQEMDLIREIIADKYTREVFIPLYNNNYRRTTKILTNIIIENPREFSDYHKLMSSNVPFYRHGARGILFKFILDLFNKTTNGSTNILKEIGVIDLRNRKNNEVSVARMLLSYLSEKTDTICSNAKQSVSLQKVIDDFQGIYTQEDILKSLLSMYMLKDSAWTHLISFSKLDSKESVKSMLEKQDFSSINLKTTAIHYSCAGKIYLEVITSHFEFFSTRIFGTRYPALFCEQNYANGSRDYLKIIQGVLREVKQCCNSLKVHNDKIKTIMAQGKTAVSENDYLNSSFVATIKKTIPDTDEIQIRKQFHEDRLINSHIGYIDRFRLYLLNGTVISPSARIAVNKSLCEVLNEYVDLLEHVSITDYTQKELLPFYRKQLGSIEKTGYSNFYMPVKKNV